MLVAIAVNGVGIGLCLYAYSRPWGWERGPLMLLRGASIVLGIALLCTLAALLLEVPEARGVVVVVALVVVGIAIWRKAAPHRRETLTSETPTPAVSAAPPRSTGGWQSVTLRDIEKMEVRS